MSEKSRGSRKVASSLPAHPLVIEVVELLRSRGQTLAFAESCTGGLLSAVLTRMPGVSDVFAGSVIAYSYAVKESLLFVPESVIRANGAVSLPVAKRMASGAKKKLRTSWAVSVTGIAGPGGGTPTKPVGTVCFGIAGPGLEESFQRKFSGTRREIQLHSARFALKLLRHFLLAHNSLSVPTSGASTSAATGPLAGERSRK